MNVSALDSRVFRNLFGTEEIQEVFGDGNYIRCLIETEAALARAQSKIGVIPSGIGDAVTELLKKANIDYDRLSEETEVVGYPVLPLLDQLITPEFGHLGRYVHWGATTQDIMDTASVLQIRSGLQIVKILLVDAMDALKELSWKYRDTPMAGRTHMQHALPITFGYKCAVYLSTLLRHAQRLAEIEKRCLAVQFGGAAGTLASLGSNDNGLRVRRQLAVELGLQDPLITWHSARDSIAEVINLLALIGGSLGKIALDIIVMSSNEVGELSEPFVPHRGASSTMPQKRNPISSEVILAASKLLRANAGLCLDAMVVDFERASGPWHLEWVAVPESFVLAVGSLHQTSFALGGLVVRTNTMLKNLSSTRGLIASEAVMMGLAPYLGRQRAHAVVYDACKMAIETDTSLLDVLMRQQNVTDTVDATRLKEMCDPLCYLGGSGLMVDDVLKAYGEFQRSF